MNGFLISTAMNKELKAFKEFSNKANSFVNLEPTTLTNTTNFESLLLEELRNLKINDNFVLLEKYRSILVVKNKTKNLPSNIFKKLRDDNSTFYGIKRIVPLDFITKFDEISIRNFIIKNTFEGTFKIQFEGRLCADNLKSELFKIIIPLIDNKVDLSGPDFVIVIQAFKGLIGLTIMKNDVNNFNFSIYNAADQNDESKEIDSNHEVDKTAGSDRLAGSDLK